MQFRRLAVEALENRTLLAADVAGGALGLLPEEQLPGDANRDGTFDQQDLVQVFQAGKYLIGERATWSEGDWNGDGAFDQSDLVFALQTGKYDHGVAARAHGQQVERPWKIHGNTVAIVDLSHWSEGYAPYDIEEFGVATHLGRYEAYGEGVNNFVTGENTATGTFVAANGDQLLFETSAIGETVDFTIVNGTGRFEDATGSFTVTYTPTLEWDWENETLIITYSFTATGTITY